MTTRVNITAPAIDEFCCLFYGYTVRCTACPMPAALLDMIEDGTLPGYKQFGARSQWEGYHSASKSLGVEDYLNTLGFNMDEKKVPSLPKLRQAFKSKAFELHPDTGGSCEAFQELLKAYEYLLEYLKSHSKRKEPQ